MVENSDTVEVFELHKEKEGDDVYHQFDEYGSRMCFGLEEIVHVKESPYPDDWERFPGPKYFIDLESGRCLLVLGNYEEMRDKWLEYRRASYGLVEDK